MYFIFNHPEKLRVSYNSDRYPVNGTHTNKSVWFTWNINLTYLVLLTVDETICGYSELLEEKK